MDPHLLVTSVMGSVLGGGRKRSRKALRYLTRGQGSLWNNPTTLLTGLGLAWGVYETLQNRGSGSAGEGGQWGGGGQWAGGTAPSAPVAASGPVTSSPLPPLPNVAQSSSPEISTEALRLVRLAVSAAGADGVMTDKERAAVVQQAQAAGVGDVVQHELQQPRPLAEIVGGVTDATERATLYVLAFTVLRADEQLTGAERIYLAQLAHLLGLDRDTVQRLEKDTGDRIDALGDQGQLGG